MIAPELVRQAQLGDQHATEALLAAVRPALVTYCQRRIGLNDAEDAAQETLVRLANALPTYRPRKPVLAYAYGIAAHVVASAHREAYRDRTHLAAELPGSSPVQPEEQVLRAELRTSLARLVETLEPRQREIVLLRIVAGLSSKDTAELMDTTPGAVRVGQHRAIRRLRKTITSTGGL